RNRGQTTAHPRPAYQHPDPATPKTQGPIRSRTISRQQQSGNRSSRSHHQPLAPHLYLPPANRRLTSNWSLLTASFGSSTRPLKFTFKTTRPLSSVCSSMNFLELRFDLICSPPRSLISSGPFSPTVAQPRAADNVPFA